MPTDLWSAIVAAYHTPAVLTGVALQLLDVLSTLLVLRRPGGRESNPVVAALIEVVGPFWPAAKVAITTAGLVGFALSPAPILVWAVNAVMAWVVWHNLGVLDRQRRRD